MAKKKAQHHVIPRVYLDAFRDRARPPGHPPGAPYTGALWLVPKSLTEVPRRRSPEKAFRVLNAYTLMSDDPARPRIEEWLSRVEAAYARVWRRVARRAPLTADDGEVLALFVATLFLRTPEQMAHWQRQIDGVQHLYRQVDRGANGHEAHSDAYWAGADEAGKQLVGTAARGIAEEFTRGGRLRLLVNDTPEALITSDAPVVRDDVHVDELLSMGVPGPWLDPDALPNRRAFLIHCPLAPDVAVLASPLLRPAEVPYWPAPGPGLVANLNVLARNNAHRLLVASRPDPFGALKSLVLAADEAERREAADPRPLLSVYTDSTRMRIRAERLEHGRGAHVLNGRITFRTDDADALRLLAQAEHLPEVEWKATNGGSGGMRDARVVAVAVSAEGDTVLENGPEFG